MLLLLNILTGVLFGCMGGTVFVWYWDWLIGQSDDDGTWWDDGNTRMD